jgi:glycosyltransferase involved in cell wall biosynthesis
MKILVISNSNSPKRDIAHDFRNLGHDVELFLCRPYSRGDFRRSLTENLPGYTRVSKKISKPIVNRKLKKKIKQYNPDLILGDKAEMINPEILEDVPSKKILWFPDDPQLFSLGKKLSKGYDAVLTNSKCVLDNYDVPAYFFPFPMQDESYYSEKKKEYDVSFVGRCDEKRKRYLETIADNFENVYIGGPDWDLEKENITVENRWISQQEMIDVYEKSRTVINIVRTREHLTHRLFEAAATDSVVITETLSGLREFYSEDEIIDFEDKEEMVKKIETLLENDSKRAETAEKSRKRTFENYTQKGIARKIIETSKKLG